MSKSIKIIPVTHGWRQVKAKILFTVRFNWMQFGRHCESAATVCYGKEIAAMAEGKFCEGEIITPLNSNWERVIKLGDTNEPVRYYDRRVR